MKKKLFLLFILLPLISFSQTTSEKKLGSWYMYHGNHQITDRFLLQSGFQVRTYEVVENHNLSFGYLGIGYRTKSKVLFTIKYGYIEIDRSIEFNEQPNAIEHRIMEDVFYAFKMNKHRITQRLRGEHRFIHFMSSNIQQHRLRYRLGYQYPLFKKLTFDINNEFFFHSEGKSYVENRFIVGMRIKTSKSVSLNFGYMKQFINNQYLDRLQLGLVLNTNF